MVCFGIKTEYKGIKMRSRLESNIAFVLDKMNIKWEYEPQSFLLSDGTHYLPDFWLPDMKIWIEGKGEINEDENKKMMLFGKERKQEVIILSSEEGWFFTFMGEDNKIEMSDIKVGLCSVCKRFFFCPDIGCWHCRNCGSYNGDHDIVGSDFKINDILNVFKTTGCIKFD